MTAQSEDKEKGGGAQNIFTHPSAGVRTQGTEGVGRVARAAQDNTKHIVAAFCRRYGTATSLWLARNLLRIFSAESDTRYPFSY